MTLLPHIQVDTHPQVDSCIIWLHGLGADGHDFEPIVDELHLPDTLKTRFIFPHAPHQAVTLNNGYEMPAWYDLASLNIGETEDSNGMSNSYQHIQQFIQSQLEQGIPAQRIMLVGFSQGGAMTLYSAMKNDHPLAGYIALSCYLPLAQQHTDATSVPPIFMAHGTEDDVVKLEYAKLSVERLQAINSTLTFNEYPMAHSLCDAEINDISSFIQQKLNV